MILLVCLCWCLLGFETVLDCSLRLIVGFVGIICFVCFGFFGVWFVNLLDFDLIGWFAAVCGWFVMMVICWIRVNLSICYFGLVYFGFWFLIGVCFLRALDEFVVILVCCFVWLCCFGLKLWWMCLFVVAVLFVCGWILLVLVWVNLLFADFSVVFAWLF